jgi:transcription antitermination factor NusG
MTLWVAYVPRGQEFALVEDCGILGIEASAPRKVEAIRVGNRRWPEARVTPYLPNYVFVAASAEEWHWPKDIRYVRDIMGVIPQYVPKVERFIEAVESDFASRLAEIERAASVIKDREATKEQRREALKAMAHFKTGDLLSVIMGPFAGKIFAFGRMVETGASLEIEAQGDMGRIKLDPLSVRKAS